MELSDKNLLRYGGYSNGNWISAAGGQTFDVLNPLDGNLLARVADCGAEETEAAVRAAAAAFPAWGKTTAGHRADLLRRWFAEIERYEEDLAVLLTSEQGKPRSEALGEIRYGASFVQWFAEEARRTYGDVIPAHKPDYRLTVLRQPVGVVAAITPWNFPNAMITRKVAPALAAGCTVVLKPAEDTPLSALALAELAHRVGFPPGVFNVVPTSRPEAVGKVLTGSPLVRKLSFTGSTAVGKTLMADCAGTVKRLSLELGGNAPFIVFDDADIAGAVAGAMAAKFRNAGQTCVCANRILVQEAVYQPFADALRKAMQELRVGDGLEESTDIGPLINPGAREKVGRLVEDALGNGATLTLGGRFDEDHPSCYLPTLLTDVDPDAEIGREEIFGPVAALYRFTDEAHAIELANDTRAGLAAYFYGRDYARIWRVAEALEYGMVGINTGMISTAVAPFGGVKESGFGREGSSLGIEEYLTVKYLAWGGVE